MDTLASPDAPVTTEPSTPATYQPTGIERRLYAALDALGVAFIPQHPAGNFTLDAYLPQHRLAIESDGCSWHSCADCGFTGTPWDERRRKRDRRRDELLLMHYAIATIRLWGHDLESDAEALSTVRAALVRHGIALEGRSASA